MKIILFWAFSVSISLTSNAQDQGTIRKSTSHYFINDSTMVADSMFVTLSHFDKNGKLQKLEETHYLQGKKPRYYTALYKDDDHLLETRKNGRLTIKNEFDSYGTIIKSTAPINHNRDSLVITYIPKYENGQLTQRKVAQKTSYGIVEDIEYYQYQTFPDSTLVTSTTKSNNVTMITTKCYNSEKKLRYVTNTLKAPGMNESSSLVNTYDEKKNLIEIAEMINNQVVASEIFYYTNGKLTSSISHKNGLIVKTVHEF